MAQLKVTKIKSSNKKSSLRPKNSELIKMSMPKISKVTQNKELTEFLKKNKRIIKSIYLSEETTNDEFYLVVLRNNTLNNRSKFHDFLDTYSELKKTDKKNYQFRFIKEELEKNIVSIKKVNI